jgi:hypothetical protein
VWEIPVWRQKGSKDGGEVEFFGILRCAQDDSRSFLPDPFPSLRMTAEVFFLILSLLPLLRGRMADFLSSAAFVNLP